MWSPLELRIGTGYDYLGDSLFYRFLFALLKPIALGVFAILNPLLLGFQFHGRENIQRLRGRGAISICNHVHPLDCTMLGSAFFDHRLYFATLQSNLEIPLIRHLVKGLGRHADSPQFPENARVLRRRGGSRAQRADRADLSGGGAAVLLSGIRRFKNGAFAYAYDNNVPLLPSVITYAQPTGCTACSNGSLACA